MKFPWKKPKTASGSVPLFGDREIHPDTVPLDYDLPIDETVSGMRAVSEDFVNKTSMDKNCGDYMDKLAQEKAGGLLADLNKQEAEAAHVMDFILLAHQEEIGKLTVQEELFGDYITELEEEEEELKTLLKNAGCFYG